MTDNKEEKAPRFAGIGGHHSHSSGTNDWITPRWVFDRLGLWDLDPCASLTQPWPTARRCFTVADNGLLQRWDGRIWCNPPYSNGEVEPWMARMADHGRGTALIFARTETAAFHSFVWQRATALLFPRRRLSFHRPDGSLPPTETGGGNSGAPSVFCAYGEEDADRLADSGIEGAFVSCRQRAIEATPQFEMEWGEMIKQLEYSESVRPPSDQKTARGALRLLGAFNAGTAMQPGTDAERRADAERAGVYLSGLERRIVATQHGKAEDADR